MNFDHSAFRVDERRRSDDGVITGDDRRLDARFAHGVLDQPVEIRRDHDPHYVRCRQLRDCVMGFGRLAMSSPSRGSM